MTLRELYEDLGNRLANGTPDGTEVRVMIQPSYPLVHTFAGVVRKSEFKAEDMETEEEGADPEDSRTTFMNDHLYLLSGEYHPEDECYGSKAAWEAATKW